MKKVEILKNDIDDLLKDKIIESKLELNQLTLLVDVDNLVEIMSTLKNNEKTQFEQCVDLCGVDYLDYHNDYIGPRFAVVYHLLSVANNCRVRVRVFAKDDSFPVIPSLVNLWNGLNWFEREAFDLFGIVFEGHPDLRRILTDYGFIGHPFRKDFPVYGFMEMKYDHEQKRVIYQPVTIEPREITPRIIREESYGG